MSETVAWIALTTGIVAVIAALAVCVVLMRSRKRAQQNEQLADEATLRVDETADAALREINKTARLILDEIEEKYQAMLFMYHLLEEKKKEINQLAQSCKQSAPPVKLCKQGTQETPAPLAKNSAIHGSNARYDKVYELHNMGLKVSEIAKKLGIGQGEVKLIIDLAMR